MGEGLGVLSVGVSYKIHVNSYKKSVTPRDALPQLTPVNQVKVSSQLSPAFGEGDTAGTKVICGKP